MTWVLSFFLVWVKKNNLLVLLTPACTFSVTPCIGRPCNTSGWFDADFVSQYGLADFDWSNARALWANQHPMDDNGLLLKQAATVKARSPSTHVWIYRNLVKALSWYADVGEKLADEQFSGWFLQFRFVSNIRTHVHLRHARATVLSTYLTYSVG